VSYCPNCGEEVSPDSGRCSGCNRELSATWGHEAPAAGASPVVSPLAVSSLVLGILGAFSLGVLSIPGIIYGFLALSRIKKSKGMLGGRGLAISGIAVGGVTVLIWLSLSAVFVSYFLAPRAQQREMLEIELERLDAYISKMEGCRESRKAVLEKIGDVEGELLEKRELIPAEMNMAEKIAYITRQGETTGMEVFSIKPSSTGDLKHGIKKAVLEIKARGQVDNVAHFMSALENGNKVHNISLNYMIVSSGGGGEREAHFTVSVYFMGNNQSSAEGLMDECPADELPDEDYYEAKYGGLDGRLIKKRKAAAALAGEDRKYCLLKRRLEALEKKLDYIEKLIEEPAD